MKVIEIGIENRINAFIACDANSSAFSRTLASLSKVTTPLNIIHCMYTSRVATCQVIHTEPLDYPLFYESPKFLRCKTEEILLIHLNTQNSRNYQKSFLTKPHSSCLGSSFGGKLVANWWHFGKTHELESS